MLNKNFTPFPVLTTERLTLRRLEMNDAQEIFTLRSDSEINKYLDRQPCTNIEDAKNFITMVNANIDKNSSLYWAITFSEKNELVGTICLFGFSDDTGNCEIGYELLTGFQGQGIMKEAAGKVIDYAFNTIKVREIEACFHRDNQRSVKLLEKLSFKDLNRLDDTAPDLLYYHLQHPASHL
jgi:[ribosomal protein S5]-alanine N-acetyltransferase